MINISEILQAIQSPVAKWICNVVDWTPTWTASVSNPSIGNGTLTGRYYIRGSLCLTQINLVGGGSTNFGSGNWSLSLPFPHLTGSVASIGLAHIYDTSAGACYERFVALASGASVINTFIEPLAGSTSIRLTPTVPFTWANGDSLQLQIEYPIL